MPELPELAIQTAARALLELVPESLRTQSIQGHKLHQAETALRALADDGWHLTRTDRIHIVNTCGATLPGDGELPTLTCHLAHGHDGPFHRDRDGSRWEDGDG